MRRQSLRWRLAVAIAALGALLAIGIGVAVYALTANEAIDRARDAQADRAALAAAIRQRTGETVPGARVDDPRAPAPLRAAVRGDRAGTYRDGEMLWAAVPLARGSAIYVRGSVAAQQRGIDRLRDTLLLVGALATTVAAISGALLAGPLSRRLRRAAAVADRVAGGDLDARIDAPGADEVARLARAVDQMADALGARIARERRFSADVAHELRTPVTALVSAAELLGPERPAQIVRERVAALRQLVEDLLEISRLDAGAETAVTTEVDLAVAAREVAAVRGVAMTVRGSGRARTDRRRLERVLGNLLDNATRHGAPPVTVAIEGATLVVADAGPGFPQELLADGPQPFRTGSAARTHGSGLGLAIATGQASVLGGELRLSNSPAGGAVATLTLPPA